MKMSIIALIVLAASASAAHAAADLSGIGAVAQAEHAGIVAEQRRVDDQRAEYDRQMAANERRQEAEARRYASQRAEANRRAAARQAAHEKAVNEAQKRDNDYQDKLRDLELRRQQLDIAAQEARVKRENEYIDQELRAKSANSDVVKSQADATRAVAEGQKNLMTSEGQARIKKVSSWFN